MVSRSARRELFGFWREAKCGQGVESVLIFALVLTVGILTLY